jgi:hypothetical protein
MATSASLARHGKRWRFVGLEKLPAIFAFRACTVVAANEPNDVAQEWTDTGQYSHEKSQLFCDFVIDKARFDSLVSFEECNMKNISPHLHDFDLCWLPVPLSTRKSRRRDRIHNSLKTLKVGGIAIHTPEFEVSSETETAKSAQTVLYRRSDIDRMRARMEK